VWQQQYENVMWLAIKAGSSALPLLSLLPTRLLV